MLLNDASINPLYKSQDIWIEFIKGDEGVKEGGSRSKHNKQDPT